MKYLVLKSLGRVSMVGRVVGKKYRATLLSNPINWIEKIAMTLIMSLCFGYYKLSMDTQRLLGLCQNSFLPQIAQIITE